MLPSRVWFDMSPEAWIVFNDAILEQGGVIGFREVENDRDNLRWADGLGDGTYERGSDGDGRPMPGGDGYGSGDGDGCARGDLSGYESLVALGVGDGLGYGDGDGYGDYDWDMQEEERVMRFFEHVPVG